MKKLYLIPCADEINESLELAESVNAAFEYNDFWKPNCLEDAEYVNSRIDLYKSLQRDRSLDMLHGNFLDVTIHSDDPMIRRVSEYRVKQSVDIANQLGVKGVVFHTNLIPNFLNESYLEHWVQRNQNFFTEMALANPHLNFYMENMFDVSAFPLYELATVMKEITNFKICFDFAHASIFGEKDYGCEEPWFAYIGHIHINDNDGKRDSHLPVGSGCMDWEKYQRMLLAMEKKHYTPGVLIEVNELEAQRRSIAYMKERRLYPFGEELC